MPRYQLLIGGAPATAPVGIQEVARQVAAAYAEGHSDVELLVDGQPNAEEQERVLNVARELLAANLTKED